MIKIITYIYPHNFTNVVTEIFMQSRCNYISFPKCQGCSGSVKKNRGEDTDWSSDCFSHRALLPISSSSASVLMLWGLDTPAAEHQINLIRVWMSSSTKQPWFFLELTSDYGLLSPGTQRFSEAGRTEGFNERGEQLFNSQHGHFAAQWSRPFPKLEYLRMISLLCLVAHYCLDKANDGAW